MITFNGITKIISLSATTTLGVRDLWSRYIDWSLTDDNVKYLPAFRSVGGDWIDQGDGTLIPIYTFMLNGWRIRPQEANHTLNVTDGILLVDGGGDPFTETIGSYVVRINYKQPVQAVAFNVNSSGGGLTDDQAALLAGAARVCVLAPGVDQVSNVSNNTGNVTLESNTSAGASITISLPTVTETNGIVVVKRGAIDELVCSAE